MQPARLPDDLSASFDTLGCVAVFGQGVARNGDTVKVNVRKTRSMVEYQLGRYASLVILRKA